MAQNDKKNLGYLGEDFQFKLCHLLLEDKEYFKEICEIIIPDMFTNIHLKTIISEMKMYYEERDSVPSYEIMGVILNSKALSAIDKEQYTESLNMVKNFPSDGADFIKDLALRFFRQQNIVKAANEVLRIAGDGDVDKYDTCLELFTNAITKGTKDEGGTTVDTNLEEVLSDDYRIVIPTGIEALDETLEGGLGKGELGVIIGSSGFGKTSMTTAMAQYAATFRSPQNNNDGFKVLQIVFEDRIKQIQRKHIARISNIEAKDLSKEENRDQVKSCLVESEEWELLCKNLRIVKFPSGEMTAEKIRRFIKKLINNGFTPDLVVLDYFECISHDCFKDTNNDYDKEGKSMRKFEAMAAEFNIALWIPSQGTKDALKLDVITMDKMSGSSKKGQIAHIVISISRSLEDMADYRATLSVLKNRGGASGKIFSGIYFNNGTCRINTDDMDDFDSMIDFNKDKAAKTRETAKSLAAEIFSKK